MFIALLYVVTWARSEVSQLIRGPWALDPKILKFPQFWTLQRSKNSWNQVSRVKHGEMKIELSTDLTQ